jgi:AraC-like DNA-binding protein
VYQLRRPDPNLTRFLEHYWFVTSDEGPVDLRVDVFVDARADLIFNFGAPYTRRVITTAEDTHGGATVEAMAKSAAVSSRHLERLFARHLGVAPKTLARVLRFQRALGALMRDPEGTLADVAADAGYFDQAHFIKDFRRMTGGVPRGYRGYYPPQGPHDFAPNVVVFLQEDATQAS